MVVLGPTGRNFAAGMSGGVAYVLDKEGDFRDRCNFGLVDVGPLDLEEDRAFVEALVERHVESTGSAYAQRLLDRWEDVQESFVKVMPRDYRRVLAANAHALAEGREATFEELVGATSG